MKNDVDKLLKNHQNLIQSDFKKVASHVQREEGEWFINTIMLEGYDVPFKYKRQKKYRDLKGQRVNLTYYPDKEQVAGFDMEIMRVVRIKVS
ncbi:hypothetical protein [Pleionea sediminis]|uniref:hypothetical protein n=1 Tax=Pleionea sediminis TaxID=2569479 RepID=UPI001184B3DA|nr:hypothetical protein [Pleionea sediminis]